MAIERSTGTPSGSDLSERERRILEAVIRTYVETAEPAGSRTVARRSDIGVSPATVRNTMSDLEEKGYLFHPHTSAGRIPTDRAYRYFVDQLMDPVPLTRSERERLEVELDLAGGVSAVERLVQRAARALSVLSQELGVAALPRLDSAVLEKLELIQVSSSKLLLVTSIRSGVVRTIFVDLQTEVPSDALSTLTVVLNERLAGLTLQEIRDTLPARLRDVRAPEGGGTELLNIFMQSGADFLDWTRGDREIRLGQASILATQPEFTSGERLKGLMELTEQPDLLAGVLGRRDHADGLTVTIGGEHQDRELAGFTLVTAEYRVGGLSGVIGVIGPTRMPYEKVITLVDYTSSLVNEILR
jgi:heat-inducible transcriptional repressor